MKHETLHEASRDQLNLVLSFFPRVDAKLSVLFAIDTGMLAVLGSNAPSIKDFTTFMWVAAAASMAMIGTSIAFLYRGAFPHLTGGHDSLIYFREIAKRTEQKFIQEFREQSEDAYATDILGQVWRNAEILKAKFGALKIAFVLLALSIVPWMLCLILFAAHNSQAHAWLIK